MKKFTCPCCGYMTLTESPGSNNICSVCFWKDDLFQINNPTFESGANNEISLKQAQINFLGFGAYFWEMKIW